MVTEHMHEALVTLLLWLGCKEWKEAESATEHQGSALITVSSREAPPPKVP